MEESLAVQELSKATQTRQNGNEGMARVLARRSAGLSIREFLATKGVDQRGLSLNALLKDVDVRNHIPVSLHSALDRLSTRIGMDFNFPADFDLLLDAKYIIDQLIINNGDNND
jgi:hypothetical protein